MQIHRLVKTDLDRLTVQPDHFIHSDTIPIKFLFCFVVHCAQTQTKTVILKLFQQKINKNPFQTNYLLISTKKCQCYNINFTMGSLERATLCGFICRLCSEMHRVVLHIYGDEGIRLCVSEKISRYLSINVIIIRHGYNVPNVFNDVQEQSISEASYRLR